MKVILLENVKNLGKKHDVKDVKDGYGRNFLIPEGMAVLATDDELDKVEELREMEIQQAEEELSRYQAVADQMEGLEIEIAVKVSEEGKLFGAISAKQIADQLKKQDIEIEKEWVKLAAPIKELGEYDVKIEFPHNLEAQIKIVVVEEKA